ncbi:MAG: hypothetical protein ACOCWQ_03740 [Nanoarchaeota archaeon]
MAQSFNKDMEEYLEKRNQHGSYCSISSRKNSVIRRIHCFLIDKHAQIKEFLIRAKRFLTEPDASILNLSENEVQVVDTLSPAQKLWRDVKKSIAEKKEHQKMEDEERRLEEENVDPEQVADVIRKHRL